MKTILTLMLIFIGCFAFIYITVAFVSLDIDFRNWSRQTRAGCVFLSAILFILINLFIATVQENKSKYI
jgi:uncharacterized membrane protein SirB2